MSPNTATAPVRPPRQGNRPDRKRLNELELQVEELVDSGRWDYEAFLTVFQQAKAVLAGHRDGLGFLFRAAKPEWRQRHWFSD